MSVQSKLHLLGMKPSHYRHCKLKELIKLKPKDSLREPKIITCDSEDNSKGKTIMVNFFDGDYHYTFRHTEAAIEWLLEYSKQYKKGIEVWFANQQYDIGNLFRESQEFLSFTLAGSRFITGKVYQEKIKFKDILNVIPGASVKKLGNMIGMPKIETTDFDNEEYCQVDTEIVYWSYFVFKSKLKKINVELKNTAAATGFNALLKKYPILTLNNLTEEDHEFCKNAYYGGRTEVFNTSLLDGDIYGYDISSCYPKAMCEIPILNTLNKKYTKKPNFNNEGVIHCSITAPDLLFVPYLPVHSDSKLIFPIGEFEGFWTYFEIRHAIQIGYKINRINNALEFTHMFDFKLDGFVKPLYELKEKSKKDDPVMSYAAKIVLNASYGKLAMSNEKTSLVAFDEFHKIKGNFCSEVFPNNQIMVKQITDHAPSTNFVTAAYITAYARHYLYEHLIKADKIGQLIYCDTDSVFYKGPKLPDINKKTGLGDLELKEEISECQFILPKTYYLKLKSGDTLYKCKGVFGDLAKQFFTTGYAEKMSPLKYVETCRKNFQIKIRNEKNKTKEPYIPFNTWVKKPKSMKSIYDKRIRLKNGHTKPITMHLDE